MPLLRLTPLRAALVTAFSALLWGTSFPANDWGLNYTDPGTFAVVRFVIAAAVAALVALAFGRLDWHLFRRPIVWVFGALTAVGFLLQFVAQTITTPAKTALLVNANAIVVAVVAVIVLKERLSRSLKVALGVAAVGVFLLTTEGRWEVLLEGSALGDGLAFLAGATWSALIVLNKRLVDAEGPRIDVVSLIVATFTTTALLLIPLALLFWPGTFLVMPAEGFLAALYVGAVCGAVANLIWLAALRHISATASAAILLAEVPTAAILSVLLGTDTFSVASAVGAAALFTAIAWVTLSDSAKPAT
ncbi:MAG TPA: DMT family transporter [Candidatus Thermoplasmatota archaeon]|nr:DMT family transporter [Candidatus Thermoplasmatota archaeon]